MDCVLLLKYYPATVLVFTGSKSTVWKEGELVLCFFFFFNSFLIDLSNELLKEVRWRKRIRSVTESKFILFTERQASRLGDHLFSSVAQSCRALCDPMDWGCQASLSITTPRACSNSWPLSWWCHPTISSYIVPFSSCLQSFPALGCVPMSQFFTSGGQSIGVSASASVLPMNIQVWFPLGWTSWISLQSKGLSRIFSNTTAQKHQFFDAQLSLESNSHIHT